MDSSPSTATLIAAQPSRLKTLAKRFDSLFILTVFIPTLLAAIYFGLIASDVYISESRFVVKSPQRQIQGGLGALLQSTGFSRSQDDTYSVHDYILSRDALGVLEQQLNIREAFTNEHIDITNRFPGLSWDRSFEAFYRHYLRHVGIDYDTVSSISVLRVRAYTAEDAKKINDLLLDMGERLVNNLNIRSREDLIQVALNEVKQAEERNKTAAVALSSFRNARGIFDPDRQSALQLTGAAKIREDLLAAEDQLAQVKQVSPNNPQIPSLASRVELLRRAATSEANKVTGGDASLSSKSPAYDRLSLEKGFADRQLATALAALDTARNEAQRKQLYLERLVKANLPDTALEPRRLRGVATVFILGLIVWGVLSLVLAAIREHSA